MDFCPWTIVVDVARATGNESPGPQVLLGFQPHRAPPSAWLASWLLSERAEVDRTYVGLLERGQRSAGLDFAKRLADVLEQSLRAGLLRSQLFRRPRSRSRSGSTGRFPVCHLPFLSA